MKTRKKCKLKKGGKLINEYIYDRIVVIWNKILSLYLWLCEKFTKKTGREPNDNEEMSLWNKCIDLFMNQHNLSTDTNQTAITKFVQSLKTTPTEDFIKNRPSFNSPYSDRFQTVLNKYFFDLKNGRTLLPMSKRKKRLYDKWKKNNL